ncbi:hypothetical protein BS17DRAFT_229839 [Gyrodon lividus]|nr:hypothetical protein BS17DRAFT_229839 [Gyrodon lividus]
MASGTRSTRRTAATDSAITSPSLSLGHPQDLPLSTIESLILAQAVYEHGANAWQSVSKVLSKHPALPRPKFLFSPQVNFVLIPTCIIYSVHLLYI